MGILYNIGLVKNLKLKSANILEGMFTENSIMTMPYSTPMDFVLKYWNECKKCQEYNSQLKANIFRLIICTLLYREDIVPFSINGQLSQVPNTVVPIIYQTPNYPVCIFIDSGNNKLKHYDLKATYLKYGIGKGKCFLLSEDSLNTHNFSFEGLDSVIDCSSKEINDFIEKLREFKFIPTKDSIPTSKSR